MKRTSVILITSLLAALIVVGVAAFRSASYPQRDAGGTPRIPSRGGSVPTSRSGPELTAIEARSSPTSSVATSKQEPAHPIDGVGLMTDKLRYVVGEPIVVSVANDLPKVLYVPSGRTYCGIFLVERHVAGTWDPDGGRCLQGAPPGFVRIEPKTRKQFRILRTSPYEGEDLLPGLHRIVFAFKIGSPDASTMTVYSEEFVLVSRDAQTPP